MGIDDRLLGNGWYQIEGSGDDQRVWSSSLAYIDAQGCGNVAIRFSSSYFSFTERPQRVTIASQNTVYFDDFLANEIHDLLIDCREVDLISVKSEGFCPVEYGAPNDRRVLGINVFHLDGDIADRQEIIIERSTNLVSDIAPIQVQVEISTACHLSCVMCSRSDKTGGPSQHMSVEIWDKLFAAAQYAKSVNFLGLGEPWTHPRFLTYLSALDDLGVHTSITTAGDLINDVRAAALGRLKHLRDLTFSIDSPDPETYFKIRGQQLARPAAGLDRAIAAISNPDVVRVHAVVMRDSLASLHSFPEFIERHSVRRLIIRGVIQISVDAREMIPDYTHSERALILDVADRASKMGVDVSLLPSLPDELLQFTSPDHAQEKNSPKNEALVPLDAKRMSLQAKLCTDPWEQMFVTRDGDVFPCECYHLQNAVGSLAESSFSEIWNGKAYRDLRESLLADRNLGCRSCERRGWGIHPFNVFAAEEVSVTGGAGRECEIVLRNIGVSDWCESSPMRLGTARPRDRVESTYFDKSWIAADRVTEQSEAVVRPGEVGTFRFRLASAAPRTGPELFQFLVEGHCWLPSTQYEVAENGLLRRASRDMSGSKTLNKSEESHIMSNRSFELPSANMKTARRSPDYITLQPLLVDS